MKFCDKLKMLRMERGMSQTDFAKLLGTSKQVISRYEKGENTPKITTVANWAAILGVSLAFFTNDDVIDPKPKEISPAEADEMQMLLSKLSAEKKQQLAQYALFLLSQPD